MQHEPEGNPESIRLDITNKLKNFDILFQQHLHLHLRDISILYGNFTEYAHFRIIF